MNICIIEGLSYCEILTARFVITEYFIFTKYMLIRLNIFNELIKFAKYLPYLNLVNQANKTKPDHT